MINNMINICTLGSVADGKSTMVKMLTGEITQRDSRELKRNITINAGYANLKIWECIECNKKFSSGETISLYICNYCDNECILKKHISFADCPGHQELITTMLSSIYLMSGCIIVISVETPLKNKQQLKQHLLATKIANLKNIIICLNKCDLQEKSIVLDRYKELQELLDIYQIKPLIIIPTSFTNNFGGEQIIDTIDNYFNNLNNNNNDKTLFKITRTFDINKPGISYLNIKGGIIGGTLISGQLNINDEVEIRPGIINGTHYEPIITKLISFETNNTTLEQINPGGLVAIRTEIDPYYCKNNRLCNNILGKIGELPPVYNNILIEYTLLDINNDINDIWKPKNNDLLFLQIDNISCEAKISKIKKNIFYLQLKKPTCIDNNAKILICKKNNMINIIAIGKLIL